MRKTILWLATFAWAVLIFYLTSIPNLKVADDSLLSLLITSGAHFFVFGVQAVLLYCALPTKISPLSSNFSAVAVTSLYGLLIELFQDGIPGRSADPLDWALDTLGALVFVMIMRKYTK